MLFRRCSLAGLFALVALLCGCSSEPALTVDVVTGLVPGAQFTSVQVQLLEGSAVEGALVDRASADRVANIGDDYAHGMRVATFENVGTGPRTVSVRLLRRDLRLVIQRRVTLQVSDNFALRIHITPNCVGVTCPSPSGSAGFSECLDGECVDPRCNPPQSTEFCPAIELCEASGDCASDSTCAEAVCLESICDRQPFASACSDDEYCDTTSGGVCTPVPSDMDGGVLDASVDADASTGDATVDASPVCGSICIDSENPCLFGSIDCSGATPTCNATLERTGVPCGAGRVCGLRGECIDCVEDAPCQAGCATGELRCGSGLPVCETSPSAMNVAPGTPCEQSCGGSTCAGVFVCSPSGECGACDEGAPCFAGCDQGHISCAAGGVCVSDGSPAPEFTVCGESQYCDGRATCIACADGAPCESFNECASGQQALCSSATPTCQISAASLPGVACRDGICSGDAYCYAPFIAAGIAADSVGNERSTCAILPDGHISCWGSNLLGQLGWGRPYETLLHEKVQVLEIDDAVEVSGKAGTYCARRASGEVWCWGDNSCGTIGDGTLERRYAPVRALLPGAAVDIDVGTGVACAALEDGTAMCWGGLEGGCSLIGASGVAASDLNLTPVALDGIVDAVQVSADFAAACVRRADGHVMCLGFAYLTRLGDGVTRGFYDYVETPVEVLGIDDAIDISLSEDVACALRESGHVECWGPGDGFTYRFANPTYTSSNAPVPATLLTETDIVDIEVGRESACALRETGEALCWSGYDGIGILGRGSLSPASPSTPAPVLNVDDFVELSNGGYHMCGRTSSGLMLCWGGNTFDIGELGLGHGVPGYFTTPVAVRGVTP